jgi:hypothetical protein
MRKTQPKSKPRRYCPTCGRTGFVPGPNVERNGHTYTSAIRCPDCTPKPEAPKAAAPLPLDWRQRAAGEGTEN